MYVQFILLLMIFTTTKGVGNTYVKRALIEIRKLYPGLQESYPNPLLDDLIENQLKKIVSKVPLGRKHFNDSYKNDDQAVYMLVLGSFFEWKDNLEAMVTEHFPKLHEACGSNFAGLNVQNGKRMPGILGYGRTWNHHVLVFIAFGVHVLLPTDERMANMKSIFKINDPGSVAVSEKRLDVLLREASAAATQRADSEKCDGNDKEIIFTFLSENAVGTSYLYISNIPINDLAKLSIKRIEQAHASFVSAFKKAQASELKAVACSPGRTWHSIERDDAYLEGFKPTDYAYLVLAFSNKPAAPTADLLPPKQVVDKGPSTAVQTKPYSAGVPSVYSLDRDIGVNIAAILEFSPTSEEPQFKDAQEIAYAVALRKGFAALGRTTVTHSSSDERQFRCLCFVGIEKSDYERLFRQYVTTQIDSLVEDFYNFRKSTCRAIACTGGTTGETDQEELCVSLVWKIPDEHKIDTGIRDRILATKNASKKA